MAPGGKKSGVEPAARPIQPMSVGKPNRSGTTERRPGTAVASRDGLAARGQGPGTALLPSRAEHLRNQAARTRRLGRVARADRPVGEPVPYPSRRESAANGRPARSRAPPPEIRRPRSISCAPAGTARRAIPAIRVTSTITKVRKHEKGPGRRSPRSPPGGPFRFVLSCFRDRHAGRKCGGAAGLAFPFRVFALARSRCRPGIPSPMARGLPTGRPPRSGPSSRR
jgi:hypothetical protein